MGKRSSTGILLAAVTWLVIAGAIAVAYRYFLHPRVQSRLAEDTGSSSRYQHDVRMALDSFSGYCLLRAPDFHDALKRQGIRLRLDDDGADYAGRLEALRDGSADLAVFTVDSLLTAGAAAGEFPGSIVLVIDETQGADAVVAYRQGVPDFSALNHPQAGFVLTPASPSEFLARVAVANFNLPQLPERWQIEADGAEAVYKAFRASPPDARRGFVLWEPYVSKALKEPGAHVLLDSGKLSGYILDVLVVRRDFLRDEEPVVRRIVETYLRTAYAARRQGDLADLVKADAKELGLEDVGKREAEALVQGIAWRNTLENYLHFGLMDGDAAGGSLPHLEDAIQRILDVLLQTGALDRDPLDGRHHLLYYDKVLRSLKDERFHPGKVVALSDAAAGEDLAFESVRGESMAGALSEGGWGSLIPVGEMRVEPIAFGRGTARLNLSSQRHLAKLGAQLGAFPHYYLQVVGHARAEGDAEANLRLADQRAAAAVAYLVEQGLNADRLRAGAAEPSHRDGSAQSVSFVVGQVPY